MIAVFAFVGLLIGSFCGVVAHRILRGETFLTGRSRCDACGAQIATYDNIPLFSWLLLRGRCRKCGDPIPPRYPLVELILGLAYAATWLVWHDEPDAAAQIVLGLAFATMLAIITLTDLEARIIPNGVLIAAVLAAVMIIAIGGLAIEQRLVAAAIVGGLFLAIAWFLPRGFGMGDAKLIAVMSIYLGRAVAPAVLAGLLAGGLVGIALIARHGAAARKQKIPFGPYLAGGGLLGFLVGDDLVGWYVDEFFPDQST